MNWSSTGVPLAVGSLDMTREPMPGVSLFSTIATPVTASSASVPTIMTMVPWEPLAETFMT